MAHSCPECYQTCHCNGDIDDIDFGEDSPHADSCVHFRECQLDADDEMNDVTGPCWHQHRCVGCGDRWECENNLCEANETVDDTCDNCEDGK